MSEGNPLEQNTAEPEMDTEGDMEVADSPESAESLALTPEKAVDDEAGMLDAVVAERKSGGKEKSGGFVRAMRALGRPLLGTTFLAMTAIGCSPQQIRYAQNRLNDMNAQGRAYAHANPDGYTYSHTSQTTNIDGTLNRHPELNVDQNKSFYEAKKLTTLQEQRQEHNQNKHRNK